MRKLIRVMLVLTLLFTKPTLTFADCQPVYGGGQTCTQSSSFTITKNVLSPQTNTFVHDLGVETVKYHPGDSVTFHITVSNVSSTTINKVTVQDTMPDFVNFVQGPTGNFSGKTLTFDVTNIPPGQSKTFTVVGLITNMNQLQTGLDHVCLTNEAVGTSDSGQTSQDGSQFCVFHPEIFPSTVTPTTPTPPTGPEVFSLLALFPPLMAGMYLRKNTMQRGRMQ